MENLKPLFSPKSIAIVGVSDDPLKLGSVLLSNLVESKFEGEIYPVNPKYDTLYGFKVYKKISDIKDPVDLICIAIPAPFVKDIIKDAGKNKAKSAVIISAGFKEVGEEGKLLEVELLEEARKQNIRILGPNCLGLMVPGSHMNLSFAASNAAEGNVAFLSQSGAFCTAMLDISLEKNMGFTHFVSLGNKSDINENEIIENWLKDEEIKVMGAYLEEIDDGQKLLQLVQKEKNSKPIIMFKPGKTKEAKMAISSHTGSMAGSTETFKTAIDHAGIIEAKEFNHMFNLMMSFSWTHIPKGNRVAVITNAGGPGIMATDEIIAADLKMAAISEESRKKIKEVLPPTASVHNPIDVIGDALAARYKAPVDTLLEDENVDAILIILTPQLVTQIEDTAKLIVNSAKLAKKPIFAVFLGGKYVANGLMRLWDNRVPAFRHIKEAVDVIAAMYKYGQFLEHKASRTESKYISKYLNKGENKEILTKYIKDDNLALPDKYSELLAKEVGLDLPKQVLARTFDEALSFSKFIYPVVLKAPSEYITHKTEEKAVYLDINNYDDLKSAYLNLYNLLVNKFEVKNPTIIVQEQIRAAEELFVGANRDGNADVYSDEMKGFGHLLAFGKGGIYTEIFHDIAYALANSSKAEIEENFVKTKVSRIVQGARGKAPLAFDKVIDTILCIQKLVLLYPEISSIDINPLLVTKDRAISVDLKIFLKK